LETVQESSDAVLTGRDIICISGVNWDWYWLSIHQYMARLARKNRVLFINRPVAAPRAILRRLRHRGGAGTPLGGTLANAQDGLYVGAPPPVLPLRFERPVNSINQRLRRSFTDRAIRALAFERPILWIHEPDAARMVGRFREDVSVYWITDDHPSGPAFRANPTNRVAAMRARERELLSAVDLVIATAPELQEAKRQFNPNTHYVPHGVDSEHFARALLPETEVATPLTGLPAPIIGYVGQINERLDHDLIAALAGAHPEWSIALVGPVIRAVDAALVSRPNVHLVGPAPLADLPSFLKPIDVSIIPFVVSEHTLTMHPLKALEYLAAGRPVVSTPLPALRAYTDHISFASGAAEFIGAIERALAEDDEDRRASRVAFARRHSWDLRLEEISRLIAQTTASKRGAVSTPRPRAQTPRPSRDVRTQGR
jgi:glycosyltransferase involved in cell wall biosynthesis